MQCRAASSVRARRLLMDAAALAPGNRHGTVVWRGESEGTRLIWLTHDGAIQLRQAELASEQGTEGCEVVRGLLSSREASVCRHVHPQPELPFRSTHALVPLPASGSMASVLESVRRLAGVGDEQSFSFCELFAGIGGFRIGLEAIGGQSWLANGTARVAEHTCTTLARTRI